MDLNILFWILGFALLLSMAQSLLQFTSCTSLTNFTISFRISIRSSEEKYPRKQIEAAKTMQSPRSACWREFMLSSFDLTFYPCSFTLSKIYWVRM